MITIRFNNKGESGAIPITADNLNLLIDQINADNEKILDFMGYIYYNNYRATKKERR